MLARLSYHGGSFYWVFFSFCVFLLAFRVCPCSKILVALVYDPNIWMVPSFLHTHKYCWMKFFVFNFSSWYVLWLKFQNKEPLVCPHGVHFRQCSRTLQMCLKEILMLHPRGKSVLKSWLQYWNITNDNIFSTPLFVLSFFQTDFTYIILQQGCLH